MRPARLFPLALIVGAILYTWLVSPAAAPRSGVRVVTWNLRNFPSEHDLPWLAAELEAIDADVLALEEIREPARLAEVLPPERYDWIASSHGGRHGQHVVLAWRRDTVTPIGPPREHDSLSLDHMVRPGLSRRFEIDGQTFDVLAVHLKAKPSGVPLREQQWDRLAAIARGLRADDVPLLVMGDFNVTGGTPAGDADEERSRLQTVLGVTGLQPIEVGQCTAYWQGVRYDGWYEPSRLDLVFAAGFGGRRLRAQAGTHCRRVSCRPLHSTPSRPVRSLESGSDHCPVVIDL